MSSKSNSFSDGLPSYSESVRSAPINPPPSYLPQNIAAARTALISSLLTTYITPHLHGSALSGLASTTLILVPSNVSSLQLGGKVGSKSPSGWEDGSPKETVVGFPSGENLTMIRLHDQDHIIEFWRQLTVIQELGQQLRTYLRKSGHQVIQDNETNLQAPNPPTADWRTLEMETLGNGEVRVRVEVKEVCLRTENEMGLYETRTGKAIVVTMDVGS